MGNQQSGGAAGGGPAGPGGGAGDAVLESMQREADRDAHLANLDHSQFKRSKSLRKSISKRILKRHSKKKLPEDENNTTVDVPDTASDAAAAAAGSAAGAASAAVVTTVLTSPPPAPTPLDKLKDSSSLKSSSSNASKKKLTAGEPQPFPTHIQESTSSSHLRMDKLRQSFRKSLRKKKSEAGLSADSEGGKRGSAGGGGSSHGGQQPHQWQTDEINVRSGNCSFHVKYLGSVEVFESRGMQVCEEAIKVLKASKRKSVKAVLNVSGDGLRVVDDETRGLVVDQTIEKVSFCAPDRNFERGFSYICRDGTTRRWMCHGFFAIKESGERLSHALGCAFAVCLERKQKRDKDCSVTMNFDNKNSTFTRLGSFRQATITERLQDPQMLKPSPPKPEPSAAATGAGAGASGPSSSSEGQASSEAANKVDNPFAIARPHATDLMFQRQASFRGFAAPAGGSGSKLHENSPFKRQLSLRISDLPSTVERKQIAQGINNNKRSEAPQTANIPFLPTTTSTTPAKSGSHLEELSTLVISHTNEAANTSLFDSPEIEKQNKPFTSPRMSFNPLQTVPENQLLFNSSTSSSGNQSNHSSIITPSKVPLTTAAAADNNNSYQNNSSNQFNSLPFDPLMTSSMSIKEEEEQEEEEEHSKKPTSVKQVNYDVWDLVPGQPNLSGGGGVCGGVGSINGNSGSAVCDSSSGISSSSSTTNKSKQDHLVQTGTTTTTTTNWLDQVSELISKSDSDNSRVAVIPASSEPSSGLLDDPFDADWAALATRSFDTQKKNPFHQGGSSDAADIQIQKAFELQM